MKTPGPGALLILAGVGLEFAHSRVLAGAGSSFEGRLANLDEITGASFRLGFVLVLVGVFLVALSSEL